MGFRDPTRSTSEFRVIRPEQFWSGGPFPPTRLLARVGKFHPPGVTGQANRPEAKRCGLPAGDHQAAVWALLPRVGVTDMWNAFSPERAACAESSKRRGHKETRSEERHVGKECRSR